MVDFARAAQPLQALLDPALAAAPRRAKRVASWIGLTLGNAEHIAFDQLKEKLTNAASLAYPHPDATMCLITDASDEGYGIIVTQVKW